MDEESRTDLRLSWCSARTGCLDVANRKVPLLKQYLEYSSLTAPFASEREVDPATIAHGDDPNKHEREGLLTSVYPFRPFVRWSGQPLPPRSLTAPHSVQVVCYVCTVGFLDDGGARVG
jgi:hypothetical protein